MKPYSDYYSQGIFQTKRRDFLWIIRGFYDYRHSEKSKHQSRLQRKNSKISKSLDVDVIA